jgi:hypothetical protein
MEVLGGGYSSYSFSTSVLDGGESSASRPGRALHPGERTPGTHCTGGWVGPRAGLDTEDRGKIHCLCRGSNPDRPVVQPVVRHYTAWANPAPLITTVLFVLWMFSMIHFPLCLEQLSLGKARFVLRPHSLNRTDDVKVHALEFRTFFVVDLILYMLLIVHCWCKWKTWWKTVQYITEHRLSVMLLVETSNTWRFLE